MAPPPVVLTVAGSDPSGGAGLQADLRTFHQHGVYGCAAAALLTVQNTLGVSRNCPLEPQFVADEVRAVLEDFPVAALKTGALGNLAIACALADVFVGASFPWVLDPVMISSSGHPLLAPGDAQAVADLLFPRARLVTPNLDEASFLLGRRLTRREELPAAAEALSRRYGTAVLLKGGHLDGAPCDVLCDDGRISVMTGERIETRHSHGTGCVLSSAIAAHLAWGRPLDEAVRKARQFVARALATAPGLGRGHGPMNLWAEV